MGHDDIAIIVSGSGDEMVGDLPPCPSAHLCSPLLSLAPTCSPYSVCGWGSVGSADGGCGGGSGKRWEEVVVGRRCGCHVDNSHSIYQLEVWR